MREDDVPELRAAYENLGTSATVLAVGACACGGSARGFGSAQSGGIAAVLPVELYVPGCPPRPDAITAAVRSVLAVACPPPSNRAGSAHTVPPVPTIEVPAEAPCPVAEKTAEPLRDEAPPSPCRFGDPARSARGELLLAERGLVPRAWSDYDSWFADLDQAVLAADWVNGAPVLERGGGSGGFAHALAYCQALESLLAIDPPPRARYLRVVWSELQRLLSHYLWLEQLAERIGLAGMPQSLRRQRWLVMDQLEATAGNRLVVGTCAVGGVRRDISAEGARHTLLALAALQADQRQLCELLNRDEGVKALTVGIGMLSLARCLSLGLVGPGARASGVTVDARLDGDATYASLGFAPVVETAGDLHARLLLLARELEQSTALISRALRRLPEGPVLARVRGNPLGRAVVAVEHPHGRLVYTVAGDNTRHLTQLDIHTPGVTNLPALLALLPGDGPAQAPLLASFAPRFRPVEAGPEPVSALWEPAPRSAAATTEEGFVTATTSPPAGSRGRVEFALSSCGFCGSCARRCPAGAVTVNRVAKTLTIARWRCVVCGVCAEICPRDSIRVEPTASSPLRQLTAEIYTPRPE